MLLEASPADHLRLDIDEKLIDLPWELIHDGTEFLCLRYAVGRRLVSDHSFQQPRLHPRSARDTRVLVVADPTNNLPAAKQEGTMVSALLRDRCGMRVDESARSGMTKKDFLLGLRDYDIVHFAGHASHDPSSPDESCLILSDGEIQAFEIARFIANRSPAVVFLNACWSAEELRDPESYSPMMRGLGRTFLFAGVSAFLGYLVPVPDESATLFAVSFYEALAQGQTIGESVRRSRIVCRDPTKPQDLMWSSALLYGDPTVRPIDSSESTSA
jgi:CHAT domain-containing protein